MKTLVFENHNELFDYATKVFTDLIKSKNDAVLGLATGRTPLTLYDKLVEDFVAGNTSYRLVTTFNLDEYVGLSPNHPQSYRTYMDKMLFDRIDIDKKNTHFLEGTQSNLQAECQRYDELMKRFPIDIQLLGLGENGHIGFNEPTLNPVANTHVVQLSQSTLKANSDIFGDIDLMPKTALTMGIDSILAAKKILLIVTGKNKASALFETLHGHDQRVCPSVALQRHNDVTILCDKASAWLVEKSKN